MTDILQQVPATTVPGDYKLRVEGLYLDTPFGGRAFVNETQLTFSKRFMTIFIQMDKPVYMQGQTGKFHLAVAILASKNGTLFFVNF